MRKNKKKTIIYIYQFYLYLIRSTDADICQFLFTYPLETINGIRISNILFPWAG